MPIRLTEIMYSRLKEEIYSVRNDFTHHFWTLLIIFIGLTPGSLSGYGHYLLILLLLDVFISFRITINSILTLLFGIIYTVTMYLGGIHMDPSIMIFYLLYPFILYQVGFSISSKLTGFSSNTVIISILICLFATPAIISCIKDTIKTGQLINSMRLITSSNDTARSATNYGMMLSMTLGCIGLLFYQTRNKFVNTIKIGLILFSLLSLFSTIHLINRTGLALSLISIILVLVIQPLDIKRLCYCLVVVLIGTLIFTFVFEDSIFYNDAVSFYETRDSGVGFCSSSRRKRHSIESCFGNIV